MRNLYQDIEMALGVRARSSRPLSGGCVGEVYRVGLEDGREVVVKVDNRPHPKLDIEGAMLAYLRERDALPVPEVLHVGPQMLVMAFVEGESNFNAQAQEHAADLLAHCHSLTAEKYGFDRDTLIGGLHQPNPKEGSWVEFFVQHRLLRFSEEALREGKMEREFYRRVLKFSDTLGELLEEPERPSLLHGDVWTTNVLAHGGRITGFIDPAIYYGHPEIELAFITLFNTFGDPFFRRYAELRGIRDGFLDVRRDIYNLFPLLVHARLFGPSYLSGVDSVLRRHGC